MNNMLHTMYYIHIFNVIYNCIHCMLSDRPEKINTKIRVICANLVKTSARENNTIRQITSRIQIRAKTTEKANTRFSYSICIIFLCSQFI